MQSTKNHKYQVTLFATYVNVYYTTLTHAISAIQYSAKSALTIGERAEIKFALPAKNSIKK